MRFASKLAAIGVVAILGTTADASAQMCVADIDNQGWERIWFGFQNGYEEGSGCAGSTVENWLDGKKEECSQHPVEGYIDYGDFVIISEQTPGYQKYKVKFLCLNEDEQAESDTTKVRPRPGVQPWTPRGYDPR